jgi:hypothetical protein
LENKIKIGKRHKRDTKYTLETQAINVIYNFMVPYFSFFTSNPTTTNAAEKEKTKKPKKGPLYTLQHYSSWEINTI